MVGISHSRQIYKYALKLSIYAQIFQFMVYFTSNDSGGTKIIINKSDQRWHSLWNSVYFWIFSMLQMIWLSFLLSIFANGHNQGTRNTYFLALKKDQKTLPVQKRISFSALRVYLLDWKISNMHIILECNNKTYCIKLVFSCVFNSN